MSIESRSTGSYRGHLHDVDHGGACASLQQIGAIGIVSDTARENLDHFREKAVDRQRERSALQQNSDDLNAPAVSRAALPSYFLLSPGSAETQLVDYRTDGYNLKKAQQMMNESVLPLCRSPGDGCKVDLGQFFVVKMQRLENARLFERFRRREIVLSRNPHLFSRDIPPDVHPWIRRLQSKNGLPPSANAHYTLHGTKIESLQSISQKGLCKSYAKSGGLYGKGLYFTDSSCKAKQFGDGEVSGARDCVLICRVILGYVEIVPRACSDQIAPASGFNSKCAKKGPHDNTT